MDIQGFHTLIQNSLGQDVILGADTSALQPSLTIEAQEILRVCQFLQKHEKTYFDFLSCLTGIDNGASINTMEVVYNLYSIPYNHHLVLKTLLPRQEKDGGLPKVHSVASVWQSANWHEREAYDLLGIEFVGHPDLRRILLPKDWEGHPLRKDYKHQERYHGIKVEY